MPRSYSVFETATCAYSRRSLQPFSEEMLLSHGDRLPRQLQA